MARNLLIHTPIHTPPRRLPHALILVSGQPLQSLGGLTGVFPYRRLCHPGPVHCWRFQNTAILSRISSHQAAALGIPQKGNLFHRSEERVRMIADLQCAESTKEVLGGEAQCIRSRPGPRPRSGERWLNKSRMRQIEAISRASLSFSAT